MAIKIQNLCCQISTAFERIYRNGRPLTRAVLTFVLCVSIAGQNWKAVHDGVEYATVNYKLGSDPVKINLLRLDRTKIRLDVVHANDLAIGTETTSSIAKRRGAIAAINGGFFRLDKSAFAGEASGLLMIDRVLISESTLDRTAVFISDFPLTNLGFGRIKTEMRVTHKGKTWEITGINRERTTDDVILYDRRFGATTMTPNTGIELTVLNGKVTAINKEKGSTPIPMDGEILSISGKWLDAMKGILPTDPIDIESRVILLVGSERYQLDMVDDIVAGVPQLIKNGKIDITWEQEKASKAFVETRHPRTAVATLKDGKFLMVTVDGRQPGVSVGMNLYELANYLMTLGAVNAINLDGGGSTTMFLNGKVVNTPSDKEGERKVGDAILVILRKKK